MKVKTQGSCATGKLRYGTGYMAQLALDSARALREKQHNPHVECRIYKCQQCGGWHLTSQPLKTEPVNTPPKKPLILTYKEV